MHIVLHAHHAHVPEPLVRRAEEAVERLAARLAGPLDAVVRFAGDGALRRVEVTVRVARRAPLVAVGEGRAFDAALADAIAHLDAGVARRRAARARRVQAAKRGAEARRRATLGPPPAAA